MKISRERSESLSIASVFILGLFPIVPFVVKPLLILPFSLFSIAYLLFNYKELSTDRNKIYIGILMYLVFFVGYLYSGNWHQSSKFLVRLLPFLILPICFSLIPNRIYYKAVDAFFKVFTNSCGAFCFIIFIYAYSLNTSDIGYIYAHISNKFWGYSDHPIYISLYLGISILLILFYLKRSYWYTFLFGVILFTFLFLARKGNTIGLIMVLICTFFISRKTFLRKRIIIYSALSILVLLGTLRLFDNNLLTRFSEIFYLNDWTNSVETSTGIRRILWKTCMALTLESPLFGYGLGNVQDVIDARLIQAGYEELTTVHTYNAHNEYLQIILSTGYLGLLIILGIILYILKLLYIRKRKASLYICLYIIICFTFESLLERQNGIIITAIFFNLFLFYPDQDLLNNSIRKK